MRTTAWCRKRGEPTKGPPTMRTHALPVAIALAMMIASTGRSERAEEPCTPATAAASRHRLAARRRTLRPGLAHRHLRQQRHHRHRQRLRAGRRHARHHRQARRPLGDRLRVHRLFALGSQPAGRARPLAHPLRGRSRRGLQLRTRRGGIAAGGRRSARGCRSTSASSPSSSSRSRSPSKLSYFLELDLPVFVFGYAGIPATALTPAVESKVVGNLTILLQTGFAF